MAVIEVKKLTESNYLIIKGKTYFFFKTLKNNHIWFRATDGTMVCVHGLSPIEDVNNTIVTHDWPDNAKTD